MPDATPSPSTTAPHAVITRQVTAGKKGLRVFVFAGQPLREPSAERGPFVMNTNEELEASFAEFRRTGERFGL